MTCSDYHFNFKDTLELLNTGEEGRSVLLANYLMGLNYETYLALGLALPQGETVQVLFRHQNGDSYWLIDSTTGRKTSVKDCTGSMQQLWALVNKDNVINSTLISLELISELISELVVTKILWELVVIFSSLCLPVLDERSVSAASESYELPADKNIWLAPAFLSPFSQSTFRNCAIDRQHPLRRHRSWRSKSAGTVHNQSPEAVFYEVEEDPQVATIFLYWLEIVPDFYNDRTRWNRHGSHVFRDVLYQLARGSSFPSSPDLNQLLETFKVIHFLVIFRSVK